jgi:hypothetical protein
MNTLRLVLEITMYILGIIAFSTGIVWVVLDGRKK